MAEIAGALGPLFLLILLGAGLGRLRQPDGEFWAQLERLIYFLLFPAMLVATLATADVGQVPVDLEGLHTVDDTIGEIPAGDHLEHRAHRATTTWSATSRVIASCTSPTT